MKKIIIGSLMASMLLVTSMAQDVSVYLNNKRMIFDQKPIIENGRTLVPLRSIFEGLGAEVKWDAGKQEITGTTKDKEIILRIGDTLAYVNSEEVELDVPAKIKNGRTLVPLRFISESLDAYVEWDADTYTIDIEGVNYEEYDERGNVIKRRISSEETVFYKYDEKGNKIHERYNKLFWYNGIDTSYEYDEDNRLIYKERNEGRHLAPSVKSAIFYEYDIKGSLRYEYYYDISQWSSRKCSRTEYFYDEEGFLVENIKKIGVIEKDNEGNVVYYKDEEKFNDGWEKYKYDKNGNVIYEEITSGFDENGWAIISINSKYGCIDTEGNEIIPCIYSSEDEVKTELEKIK